LTTELGRGERIVVRTWGRAWPPGGAGAPAGAAGDEVAVSGRLVALGRLDAVAHTRGAHAVLLASSVSLTGSRRGGVFGLIDRLRSAAENALDVGLEPPQAALARGMVLGEDSSLDQRTREDFRASGLAHLLAASGANVALLAVLAIAVLRALGGSLRVRLGGALALVALYVPLAGGGASIVRAGVMGAAALVAGLAGRPASRVYALLLAAAVTLVANPRASADPGWQLSFAAVLAIALFARRWREALIRRRLPVPLAEAVSLTAAATIGTAPLIAAHFGQVSLVSLPANVLAAPAVAPIVWLGTTAAALGQIPAGWNAIASNVPAPLAGPIGAVPLASGVHLLIAMAGALCAPALGFVGWVARVAARAPVATVPIALAGPAAVVAAYLAIGIAVVSRRMRFLVLGAVGTLALATAWSAAHPPGPPAGLVVSFLDVGQGDATLVQHGHASVLVDTGPPGAPLIARLRSAGVRRLDLLVLTHAQLDHEGNAATLLAAMPVASVLDGGDGAGGSLTATVAGAEVAARARVVTPDAGQVVRAGPIRLDVLWPPREPAAAQMGADPNARAIVAVLSDGAFRMLLTADAESDVTGPLALPRVDVLKVAHHGSDDPGLPALLARLRPSLAAIEVGAHNTYGHPSPTTLAALRSVPGVVRTDLDGTVRVVVNGGRMVVQAHA